MVKTIGIVGGGQLGRMLTLAAKPLGFDVIVLDSDENCPAAQVGANVIIGELQDPTAIAKLGDVAGVVTIEIEHIDVAALEAIEANGTPVHPSPATIRMIQDKFAQKMFLKSHGIAVAESIDIPDSDTAYRTLKSFGGAMLLKTKHGAYDGRGNAKVSSSSELEEALKQFEHAELYAEKLVDFTKELAVMVSRDIDGTVRLFPITETIHERNICIETLTPAPVTEEIKIEAQELALKTAELLQGAGVFGIEMFLTSDGDVLVNEIAPRVHNSGHYTMNACITSQFEQHIRAVAGLPLGSTAMTSPAVVMHNVLGERNGDTHLYGLENALNNPGASVHLYGKSPTKIDRKMGHINVVSETLEQARNTARTARGDISL